MTLQEKVIMHRAKNGFTQKEFAKLAKISEPTLVAFEAGKHVSRITEAKIKIVLGEE